MKQFEEGLMGFGEYIGEVVDNNDPDFSGRCKIRIYGKMDGRINQDLDDSEYSIPDDDLPWAYPGNGSFFAGGDSLGAGFISVPKVGSKVKVRFSAGNVYSPEYYAVQDLNKNLVNEIKDSYQNAHVLFYDEDENVKVVCTQKNGFEIFYKESHIVINPDSSITIEHKDTSSIIELVGTKINITANSIVNVTSNSKVNIVSSECDLNGTSVTKLGPAPVFSGVKAEPLWAFLKMLASAVDAKNPSTPGIMSSSASSFEKLSTSKNVKLT